MKKPKADEPRNTLYLVTVLDVAGEYVGETDTHIVLSLGGGAVKGYTWAQVEPVQLKATEK